MAVPVVGFGAGCPLPGAADSQARRHGRNFSTPNGMTSATLTFRNQGWRRSGISFRQGAAEFRDPNPAFDTDWYPRAYPDIAGAGVALMEHFVRFGAAEGRLPFRGFNLYLQAVGSAHGSNLQAHRQYLAQRPQPGIPRTVWGAAADAEIRCLKEPSFDGELALFVTHSPDGWLKPHVRHYVDSLRREGSR